MLAMRNIVMVGAACTALAACNSGTLLDATLAENLAIPDGTVFVQMHVQSAQDLAQPFLGGKDRTANVEDVYSIQVEAATLAIGGVTFSQDTADTTDTTHALKHEGEHTDDTTAHDDETASTTHDEPTGCDFAEALTAAQTIDLVAGVTLPCVVLDEGSYTALTLAMQPTDAAPLSFVFTGTASRDGVDYPFAVRAAVTQTLTIAPEAAWTLSATAHHLAVTVDVKSWLHGVDFAQLEQVDGIVEFSPDHNTQRYEHMVFDHVPGSLLFL